jgi:hypothetical protein
MGFALALAWRCGRSLEMTVSLLQVIIADYFLLTESGFFLDFVFLSPARFSVRAAFSLSPVTATTAFQEIGIGRQKKVILTSLQLP